MDKKDNCKTDNNDFKINTNLDNLKKGCLLRILL
jgi:hypothetical protein